MARQEWQGERLLQLFFWLIFSILVGGVLVNLLAHRFESTKVGGISPLAVMISGLSFHGAALPLIGWFLRRHGKSWADGFGWKRGNPRRMAGVGVLTGVLMLIGGYALLWGVSTGLERLGHPVDGQEQVALLVHSEALWVRVYLFVIAVLVAPVVEEALFRGILFSFVRDRGFPRLAIWGTGILFGAVHANLAAMLPLTLVGVVLARLYERTGNLLAPIVAHACFNLAPFVLLLLGVDLEAMH